MGISLSLPHLEFREMVVVDVPVLVLPAHRARGRDAIAATADRTRHGLGMMTTMGWEEGEKKEPQQSIIIIITRQKEKKPFFLISRWFLPSPPSHTSAA